MKSLEEEVRNATDDKVNAARLALNSNAKRIDGELNQFSLHTHMAIVQMLQIMAQHRQQAMQLAATEFQRQEGLKAQSQQEAERVAAWVARERAKAARVEEEEKFQSGQQAMQVPAKQEAQIASD